MILYYPVPELLPDVKARFIQIVNTAAALAQAGTTVKLLTGMKKGIRGEDIMKFYDIEDASGLEFVSLPIFRKNVSFIPFSWNGIFHLALTAYLAGKRKKGVLFVRHPKLAFFLLRNKRLFDMPLIYEAHELFHRTTEMPAQMERIKNRETYIYNNADAVIAISEDLKNEITSIFSPSHTPVTVIPNGVRNEFMDLKGESHLRQKRYLFYCGSLYPWKGVDTIISAMKRLPGETLMILGGGDRLPALRRLAQEEAVEDRIVFAGAVPQKEVGNYLLGAKIAFIPNLPEPASIHSSPLKMFEYMAAEVPIVASRLPGIMDILQDGHSALFFDPGDDIGLARAATTLLHNKGLAETLAANARIRIGQYTYATRAQRIQAVIGELKKRRKT